MLFFKKKERALLLMYEMHEKKRPKETFTNPLSRSDQNSLLTCGWGE